MKAMGTRVQRAVQGGIALLALVLLASCGGGTEAINPFEPRRLLVLGDDMSVMTNTGVLGRKYSINAVSDNDNTVINCNSFPLWHQAVAGLWNFAYAECNPNNHAQTPAKIYAQIGAKVDDLPTQLAVASAANGSFNNRDLFMVLVGANDVLDLYQNVYLANPSTATYNAVLNELTARGTRLGQFVNQLTRANVLDLGGPKVIISTMPLMNLTPYARAQSVLYPALPVQTALHDFSNALNTAMRVAIVNDGRFIGLIELDAILNTGFENPGTYGLTNVKNAACAVALPDCDNVSADLVTNGNATTWMWASNLWMGPTAHANLGRFARTRAQDNPF